ncbi:MAG: FecR domain-containing protein [Robiginitomaculum sp.]|nr:FecR domain-containing protein [Robiginitomaculum sp.]
MKHNSYFLASAIATALLLLSVNTYALDEIGINSAVKGDVMVQSGEQIAKQALVKDPIHIGDEVNSFRNSSLQVLLKDQTVFTVGPDCQLTIDKFVYDPNDSSNGLKATVSKGMFRFMSGNISKSGPQSITIDTPVASMGVRGTMVEGLVGLEAIEYARQAGLILPGTKVDPEGATIFVLRGPGQRSRARNRKGEISVTSGGRTVTTRRSGYAIFVSSSDSPPSDPFQLDAKTFNVFNARLRTEPTGGVSFKPFEWDTFMQADPPQDRGADNPFLGDTPNEIIDPSTTFDWPSEEEEDIIVPDCTPQNSDYPDCLL